MDKVSIVITSYFEKSKEYLDACIKSIDLLNYPKKLIDTVLVTPRWLPYEYANVKTVHPSYGAYYNGEAVNFGFAQSNQDSKYVLMINDDVILTRNSLIKMTSILGDNNMILGAVSNCDNGDFYWLDLPLGLNQRQYRMEQVKDKIDKMIFADIPTSAVKVISTRTLYLYANLFPRRIWNSVKGGTTPDSIGFDQNYKVGYDDTDYVMRCQQNGVMIGVAADALIWHASGATADTTIGPMDSDIRAENERYFKKKWSIA